MRAQFDTLLIFEMATVREVAFRYILHLNYDLSCIYLKSIFISSKDNVGEKVYMAFS